MVNVRDFNIPVSEALDLFSPIPRIESVSRDDAQVFSNSRRREIVKQLSLGHTTGTLPGLNTAPLAMDRLVDRIATIEEEKTLDELEDGKRKSVYSSLFQHHIPRLEDKGWVTYHEDNRIVEPESILLEKSMEVLYIEGLLNGDSGYRETCLEKEEARPDIYGEGISLPADKFYDTLSNDRRRRSLEYISHKGTSEISGIAEALASIENEKTPSEITSKERKRTIVPLYQNHLPKMDRYDIISFDKNESDSVRPGEHFDIVIDYIDEEIPEEFYSDPYLIRREE